MVALWTYYVVHRITVIVCRIRVTVRVSMIRIRVRVSINVRITAEVGMPVPKGKYG